MGTKTCPACGGSGNPSVAGERSSGCMSCGGKGWVTDNSSDSGGGRTDCFPGDALVLTPSGYRRIDQLVTGTRIIGVDSSGTATEAVVKRHVPHRPHPILQVRSTIPGLSFFATKRHPVLTERGWVRISQLRPGDLVHHLSNNGRIVTHAVESVVKTERIEPVYNIVVDGEHTFAVQGCIAHSFVHFRLLRCLLSKLSRIPAPIQAALRGV
jgi:hypothetical protein